MALGSEDMVILPSQQHQKGHVDRAHCQEKKKSLSEPLVNIYKVQKNIQNFPSLSLSLIVFEENLLHREESEVHVKLNLMEDFYTVRTSETVTEGHIRSVWI